MAWPWLPEPRCGYAGAARRCILPWGRGMRPRSRPSSLLEASKSVRSRYFRKAMASFQAVPYERPSHIRLFLDTLLGTIAHHSLLLPSSRCLVSLARLPYGSLPPQWRLLSLTSDERCCRTPPIACRQLDHKSSVLSLPFGRRVGYNSDWCLANRTVALGPLRLHSRALPGAARAHHLQHCPLHHTQTRPKGIDRGGNARKE